MSQSNTELPATNQASSSQDIANSLGSPSLSVGTSTFHGQLAIRTRESNDDQKPVNGQPSIKPRKPLFNSLHEFHLFLQSVGHDRVRTRTREEKEAMASKMADSSSSSLSSSLEYGPLIVEPDPRFPVPLINVTSSEGEQRLVTDDEVFKPLQKPSNKQWDPRPNLLRPPEPPSKKAKKEQKEKEEKKAKKAKKEHARRTGGVAKPRPSKGCARHSKSKETQACKGRKFLQWLSEAEKKAADDMRKKKGKARAKEDAMNQAAKTVVEQIVASDQRVQEGERKSSELKGKQKEGEGANFTQAMEVDEEGEKATLTQPMEVGEEGEEVTQAMEVDEEGEGTSLTEPKDADMDEWVML